MTMALFIGGLLAVCLGGIGALAAGRRSSLASGWAATCIVAGSSAGLWTAASVLRGGGILRIDAAWAVPGGRFALVIDPLAACFLAPLFVLSIVCAVYGAAYLAPVGRTRRLGSHWFFYCGLVVAMALVLTAADALLFLAVWECMSLASFFLVAFDQHRPDVSRAAWQYLLACHLGGAALLAMFLLAGRWCGGLGFAGFERLATAGPGLSLSLFLLAIVGFGTKAGLFPLHVWLPDAHPAAPSHVSALMSAVMVKTGIYGLLRVLTWLNAPPAWWGLLLAGLGASGALYGIGLSIVQGDVKRCLAYSTVENVGIVFIGLGLGYYGLAQGQPAVAVLGFGGGLLHVWNHSLFKGLLFLGAGSLAHGAGTRELDRMGGLLRRLPATGALVIAGCLAIAALPPFNGLVGEWLIYLGLLQAGLTAGGLTGLMPLLLAGALALCGALALIAFTRLAGLALLGEPRSPQAGSAHEAPPAMILPMALLLLPCLVIGVWPQAVAGLLSPVVETLAGGAAGTGAGTPVWAGLATLGRASLAVVAVAGPVWLLLAGIVRRRKVPRLATWGCGYSRPSSRMAYTAVAYGELTQSHLLPSLMKPEVEAPVLQGPFPPSARLRQLSRDPVLMGVFEPVLRGLADRAVRLRWLQQGRLPIYLLYMFVTCAALLVWSLFVFGEGSPR